MNKYLAALVGVLILITIFSLTAYLSTLAAWVAPVIIMVILAIYGGFWGRVVFSNE